MHVEAISPAMRYRMGLRFDRLDSRKSDICLAWLDVHQQGVLVSVRIAGESGDWRRMQASANNAWQKRYGCQLPADAELLAVETQLASSIQWMPESGMRPLGADELAVACRVCDDGNDFTLDVLWLLVEGLGWTLGKPVPYTDPGWLAVWAEEEHCAGFMSVVCHALGMDEPQYSGRGPVMPDAVSKAYGEAGLPIF